MSFIRFVIKAVEMQKFSQKTSKSKGKGKIDSFVWSDDEMELWLKITHKYKVYRISEFIDWETFQTNYSDICELLHEQYPSSEDAEELGKDYPQSKEEITKDVVTTKLKLTCL